VFTYYDYPTSLSSAAFSKTMTINNPAADSNFRTFEVTYAPNKSTVTAWNLQSSANYLRPSLILFPRILQIGATLNF
jgi:hypothetical protein